MWSRSFRRFPFELIFGALCRLFQLSRGGMDPNGGPDGDG